MPITVVTSWVCSAPRRYSQCYRMIWRRQSSPNLRCASFTSVTFHEPSSNTHQHYCYVPLSLVYRISVGIHHPSAWLIVPDGLKNWRCSRVIGFPGDPGARPAWCATRSCFATRWVVQAWIGWEGCWRSCRHRRAYSDWPCAVAKIVSPISNCSPHSLS